MFTDREIKLCLFFVPFVLVRHCVITDKRVVLYNCVGVSLRKSFKLGGFVLQFIMK